jgi:hypothetical protein
MSACVAHTIGCMCMKMCMQGCICLYMHMHKYIISIHIHIPMHPYNQMYTTTGLLGDM